LKCHADTGHPDRIPLKARATIGVAEVNGATWRILCLKESKTSRPLARQILFKSPF